LFVIAEGQSFGFFFEGIETEACGAGLGDDEMAVFKQEFAGGDEGAGRSCGGDFF
jgi:hypothetical protein